MAAFSIWRTRSRDNPEVVADLFERLATLQAKSEPPGDNLAVTVSAQLLKDLLNCRFVIIGYGSFSSHSINHC